MELTTTKAGVDSAALRRCAGSPCAWDAQGSRRKAVVTQGGLERGVAVAVLRSNYQRLISLPLGEFCGSGVLSEIA